MTSRAENLRERLVYFLRVLVLPKVEIGSVCKQFEKFFGGSFYRRNITVLHIMRTVEDFHLGKVFSFSLGYQEKWRNIKYIIRMQATTNLPALYCHADICPSGNFPNHANGSERTWRERPPQPRRLITSTSKKTNILVEDMRRRGLSSNFDEIDYLTVDGASQLPFFFWVGGMCPGLRKLSYTEIDLRIKSDYMSVVKLNLPSPKFPPINSGKSLSKCT
jgi:hypothetical protein